MFQIEEVAIRGLSWSAANTGIERTRISDNITSGPNSLAAASPSRGNSFVTFSRPSCAQAGAILPVTKVNPTIKRGKLC
jgi:hypothetical protein